MSSLTAGEDVTPFGLDSLFERSDLSRFDLPRELEALYGGSLGFEGPCVIANFVTSVDGVVALEGSRESGHIISRGASADQFVMGLLRACADTVVIGAGTFRKSRGHRWNAETIYPAAATLFAETRRRLGLAPQPKFVVVTGSGGIDPTEPAVENAIVATTAAGAAALRGRVPPTTRIVEFGSDALRLSDVFDRLRAEGSERILTEGGPSLFAELVKAKLLDELFVTSSPALFGRFPGDHRKSLADGLDLGGAPLELLSVRRHGSYLFFRYAIDRVEGLP